MWLSISPCDSLADALLIGLTLWKWPAPQELTKSQVLCGILDPNTVVSLDRIIFRLRLGCADHAEAALSRAGFVFQSRAQTVPQAVEQQIPHPEVHTSYGCESATEWMLPVVAVPTSLRSLLEMQLQAYTIATVCEFVYILIMHIHWHLHIHL